VLLELIVAWSVCIIVSMSKHTQDKLYCIFKHNAGTYKISRWLNNFRSNRFNMNSSGTDNVETKFSS
jgi:hypothetical protein